MKNRNENQSKHIANSVRIVGMAQFAAFGYPSWIKSNFYELIFFSAIYAIAEIVAYRVLKIKQE